MMKRLRRYFLAGLVVALPVMATVWLVTFLFTLLPEPPQELIELVLGKEQPKWLPTLVYRTLVLVGFISAITLLGAFATRTIGARITAVFQRLLERIPLFNRIYKALHQITSALFGPGQQVFRKVALIEYPREGIYTLAFITNETEESFSEKVRDAFGPREAVDAQARAGGHVNVFLPTTPNPTSGFFLVLPESSVKVLDISVEDALKLIISGGAVRLDQRSAEGANG